jgi:peptidyl-tRNA hydrolase
MLLTNPHDSIDEATLRREQDDPLVMYLVVRRQAGVGYRALLEAAARATVLAAMQFETEPDCAANFAAWYAGSFRKVTLRAKEPEWKRLEAEYAHAVAAVGGVSAVAALPPRRRSERTKFLAGLQAFAAMPAELPAEPPGEPGAAERTTMVLVVNPSLPMSAGKTMAQAGHAALMLAQCEKSGAPDAWVGAVDRWEAEGMHVHAVVPGKAAWDRALADLDGMVVTDAGVTEIEPGSRTVLVVVPARGEDLGRVLGVLGG